MYTNLRKYIIKLIALSLPLIVLVGIYVWMDPFMVIGQYEDYYNNRNRKLSLNHGYVSLANFDNHYAQCHWDSYIFGNSRSRNWRVEDWLRYLAPESKVYHMDAHSETLLGLTRKVRYLDEKNVEIKHALIIFDRSILGQITSSDEHVFMIAPQLCGFSGALAFQYEHFRTFARYKFLKNYFATKANVQPTPHDLVSGEYCEYDYTSNEIRQTAIDELIEHGGYYDDWLYDNQFRDRQHPETTSPKCIRTAQQEMLTEILQIFVKQHTDYRIVISPLYDQMPLNPADLAILYEIFGENRVFDYSGVNQVTSDYHNYYENAHYRPSVAAQILNDIYTRDE